MGPKLMNNCCKPEPMVLKGMAKMLNRIPILEDGRIPAKEAKNWRIEGHVLMPTLIRWWEAMRAPEVVKWHQKYRVDWDATDGRSGEAQQTVWEILMEMEKKIWERWPWLHFNITRKILRVLCR